MKILANFKDVVEAKITRAEADAIPVGDEIVCYSENANGNLDFKTAKAIAPVIDRMDLKDIDEVEDELGMLMTAVASAVLDVDGRSAVVIPGKNYAKKIVVDDQEFFVKVADSISGVYGVTAAPIPDKKKVEKKKPEVKTEPKPEPAREVANDVSGGTDRDWSDIMSMEVDEDVFDSFMRYFPEDVTPSSVPSEVFARALYCAMSTVTADSDVCAKLESMLGCGVNAELKQLKSRGVYEDLRDMVTF